MLFAPQSSKSLTDLSTKSLNVSTSPLSTAGLTEPRLQRPITAASNVSTNSVAETGIIIVGGSPIETEVTSLVSSNSSLVSNSVSRSNDTVGLAYDPMFYQPLNLTKWDRREVDPNNELRYLLDPTADDTLAGAYKFGNLNGKTAMRSSTISASDRIDYTRFHLDQTSSFNLLLKGAVGDAVVNLLDASGTTIASSTDALLRLSQGIPTTQNLDTHDVALNLSSLAAGDYYLQVSPFWSQQRGGRGPLERYYPATTVATDYDLTVSTEMVSNLLPTEVDLGALSGTRLLKGSLDANNTSETYRVTVGAGNLHITLSGMNGNADVRLIRDVNNDGVINENEAFASSKQWYAFTDGIYNTVRGGTYFIQVSQGQDFFGASINYDLGISTGDWYTNNLSDYGIIAKARLAGADSWIDRKEMISILREAKDSNAVDVTELADLRTVLNDLGHAMPESVSNLAYKVLYSDPANTRAGGTNIGNLEGGDSSDKLEDLIGKWFLGRDLPIALSSDQINVVGYQQVSGELFQNGVSYLDVDQGNCGDCYFLADLAAVALQSPNTSRDMFTDNQDGTFTVRLFNIGTADYVTVDRMLPVNGNGAAFAGWGGGAWNNPANELWVALAEKAYVQFNESGWLGQDKTNSYNGTILQVKAVDQNESGINNGASSIALRQITGQAVTDEFNAGGLSDTQITNMLNHFNSNQMVTIATPTFRDAKGNKTTTNGIGIVRDHVYTLIGHDPATSFTPERFRVFNPWNYNDDRMAERWISRDDLKNSYVGWSALA
jgi:Calpain family cysteine protease